MQTPQLFDLTGETALVTGGGRGIGESLAIGLAEAGADVVIASRKLDACQRVADIIEKKGRRAWALAADVSKLEDIERLVDDVLSRVSRLDILVNNAAFAWGTSPRRNPTMRMLFAPALGWMGRLLHHGQHFSMET